jgi:hypothetical protein
VSDHRILEIVTPLRRDDDNALVGVAPADARLISNIAEFDGIEPAQSATVANFQPLSAAGTSHAGRDQGVPMRE